MPELPEVETIKKGLEGKLTGKVIIDVIVENEKSFQGNVKLVIGQKVLGFERRAKVLRMSFANGFNLLFHLKMTGQLIYVDHNKRFAGGHPSHDWHSALPNKHTRITFVFEDETQLFFNDLRKFGWAKVVDNGQIDEIFSVYGIEPFAKDFTAEYLLKRAQKIPLRTAKQFIMDQSIIAGIGNIYADESLYLTKIHPLTRVGLLTEDEWKNYIKNVKTVLTKAIKEGGTTDSDYVDSDGKKGGMQNYLKVYHKTGEKCPDDCGGVIERIVVGGRGTNFCPKCQKVRL